MSDVAVLGIEIDSRDVKGANAELDRLEKQSRRTETATQKLEQNYQRLNSTLNQVKNAFAAIGLSLGVRELINYADAATNINNRLKLVTSSTGELASVQERLFGIAQDTRSAFEGTVGLYGTLARSSERLGLSQDQLFQVTESVNQTIKISGASAATASGGLTQFAQALAAGQLRGDELNSVLEGMPRLAMAVADGLNVPVGSLKQLAEQGELTADRVIKALLSQSDVIASEYAKTTGTVGDAFQRIQNSAVRAIGSINENIGGTDKLSASMYFLADNLDTVIKLIATLAVAGLAATMGRISTATLGAANAINVLTSAIAKNPFGALAVAITTAATALTIFADEQVTIMGVTAELGDFTNAAWSEIKDIISTNANAAMLLVVDAFDGMVQGSGMTGADIISTFSTTTDTITQLWRDSTNFQIAILVGLDGATRSIALNIVDNFKNAFSTIKNVASSFFTSLQDFFSGRDLTFGAFRKALHEGFVQPSVDAATEARDAFLGAFGQDFLGELGTSAVETANSAISSINTSLEEFGKRVTKTARQNKIARLQTQAFSEVMSGELNPAAKESNAVFESLRDRLNETSKGHKSAAKATKEHARELTDIERAQAKFDEAIRNYPAQQVVRDFEAQWEAQEKLKDSTNRLVDDGINPMAEAFERSFERLDNVAADFWQNLFEGGKFSLDSLKSLFTQTLAEMAHRLTTSRLTQGLSGALFPGTAAVAGGSDFSFNPFAPNFGGGPAFGPERISAMGLPTGISNFLASSSFATNPFTSGLGGLGGNFAANMLLGSNRGMGANIGGTLGAIGGSFLPLPPGIGTAIGAAIGNAIGGLFGGSKKAKIRLGTSQETDNFEDGVFTESAFGNVGLVGDRTKRVDAEEFKPFLDSIAQLDNALAASVAPEKINEISAALDGFTSEKLTSSDDFRPEQLEQLVRERLDVIFTTIDDAFSEIADSGLPLEELVKNFVDYRTALESLESVSNPVEIIGPFESAMIGLRETLDTGTEALKKLGIAEEDLIEKTAELDAAFQAASETIAANFAQSLKDEILRHVDPTALELRALEARFEGLRKEANALGLPVEELVAVHEDLSTLYELEREAILGVTDAREEETKAIDAQRERLQGFLSAVQNFDVDQTIADALSGGDKSLLDVAKAERDALQDLIREFDGSIYATNQLADAASNSVQAFVSLIQQIDSVQGQVGSTINDFILDLQKQAGLSAQEQADFLRAQGRELLGELRTESDPARIGEIVNDLTGIGRELEAVLTNHEQGFFNIRAPGFEEDIRADLISAAGEVQRIADERLEQTKNAAIESAKVAAEAMKTKIGEALDEWVANQDRIAAKQDDAANKQQSAADKQVRAADANSSGQVVGFR